jgi:hypothetical protein
MLATLPIVRDEKPKDTKQETWDEPVPAPEVLANYLGKVIAFDAEGVIRETAETWDEMMRRIGSRLGELTLMYVPSRAFIG